MEESYFEELKLKWAEEAIERKMTLREKDLQMAQKHKKAKEEKEAKIKEYRAALEQQIQEQQLEREHDLIREREVDEKIKEQKQFEKKIIEEEKLKLIAEYENAGKEPEASEKIEAEIEKMKKMIEEGDPLKQCQGNQAPQMDKNHPMNIPSLGVGKTGKRISDSAFSQNQITTDGTGLIPKRKLQKTHMTDSAFVTGSMTLKRNVVR